MFLFRWDDWRFWSRDVSPSRTDTSQYRILLIEDASWLPVDARGKAAVWFSSNCVEKGCWGVVESCQLCLSPGWYNYKVYIGETGRSMHERIKEHDYWRPTRLGMRVETITADDVILCRLQSALARTLLVHSREFKSGRKSDRFLNIFGHAADFFESDRLSNYGHGWISSDLS